MLVEEDLGLGPTSFVGSGVVCGNAVQVVPVDGVPSYKASPPAAANAANAREVGVEGKHDAAGVGGLTDPVVASDVERSSLEHDDC